jgi:hypothetical protein
MGATTAHRNRMFSLIENWQQSGLSQKVFCEQQQIAAHQFYYWYKRYRTKNDIRLSSAAQGFVELHSQEPSPEAVIEILLSCGHRILFHQPVAASFIKAIIS